MDFLVAPVTANYVFYATATPSPRALADAVIVSSKVINAAPIRLAMAMFTASAVRSGKSSRRRAPAAAITSAVVV